MLCISRGSCFGEDGAWPDHVTCGPGLSSPGEFFPLTWLWGCRRASGMPPSLERQEVVMSLVHPPFFFFLSSLPSPVTAAWCMGCQVSGYPTPHLPSVAVGGSSTGKCSDPKSCTSDVHPGGKDSPSLFSPCPPFPCLPCALPLCRLLANGVELARVLSINGAEYKQNKAFISRAVISLLIYFTVHRLFICFHVFSAGVICSSE